MTNPTAPAGITNSPPSVTSDSGTLTSSVFIYGRWRSRRAPLQIHQLSLVFVRGINATEFELHSVAANCRVHPASRIVLAEDVGHRRQIHEVQAAFVFRHVPF